MLRAILLTIGGAFMLSRAWQSTHAPGVSGDEQRLLWTVALVEALVGVLALGAAAIALLALRRRERRRTLDLRDRVPPR